MTRLLVALAVLGIAAFSARAQFPPPWAYTLNTPPAPGVKPAPPDESPRTVPGSALALTPAQTRHAFNPPDWPPGDHPPMPPSVAHGRKPDLRACGFGRTVACGTCHGVDLKGLGPVPPLAGRSPSYTVRQMYDMQQRVRKGPWSALMTAAVEQLSIDDMIAIAAYTASREP